MYMNMYTNMNMDRYVSKSWPTNLSSSQCRKIFLYLMRLIYFMVSFPSDSFSAPLLNLLASFSRLASSASTPHLSPDTSPASRSMCVSSSCSKTLPAPKRRANLRSSLPSCPRPRSGRKCWEPSLILPGLQLFHTRPTKFQDVLPSAKAFPFHHPTEV